MQGLQNLSVNCFLDEAVKLMRDRCNGLASCEVAADTFRLEAADPCPAQARYLEAHYVCNSRTGHPLISAPIGRRTDCIYLPLVAARTLQIYYS
jgi:hypothetical protein